MYPPLLVFATIQHMSDYKIQILTKERAEKYSGEITISLDQIPMTDKHSKEQLLSDTKVDRVLYGKWEHSIIMLTSDNEYIGVAIGYERKAEGNEQYPHNCIYLNDFAICASHQKKGLGKILLKEWIDHNTKIGLVHLPGDTIFAVQTNGADWNLYVQKLYENAGFKKIAEKNYPNRVDNVYFLGD